MTNLAEVRRARFFATGRIIGFPAFLLVLLVLRVPLRADETSDEPKEAAPETQAADEKHVDRHGAIYGALMAPTTVEFVDVPLSEAAAFLSKFHNIPILFDERALDDLGLTTDQPITRKIKDLPLDSVLDLILEELELTWVVRNEVLFITSLDRASELLDLRVYPVGGLLATNKEGKPDNNSLLHVITNCVAPTTWDEVGGNGSACILNAKLVVAQTEEVHRELTRFWQMLHRAIAPTEDVKESVVKSHDRHRIEIERKLEEPTTCEFVEAPLADVLAYLAERHGLQIQVDELTLDDLGLTLDQPITRTLPKIRLRSALALILEELELTAVVLHGVLMITSVDEAAEMLDINVYPVADLVPETREKGPDYGALIETITSTVEATTWDEVGGSGAIVPYRGTLVVRQTARVQERIAKLLNELRATPN